MKTRRKKKKPLPLQREERRKGRPSCLRRPDYSNDADDSEEEWQPGAKPLAKS